MPLINRVTLRDKANFLFAHFSKVPLEKPQISNVFAAAVRGVRGVCLFEDWHGTYAYTDALVDMMPRWADEKVTRFYPEFVPAAKQHLLDQWQDGGDDSGIVGYFNSNYMGYSKGMWQHYWSVLEAAKNSGIRVVGIDKPEIQNGYGAVFTAPFKNMFFETIIQNDQKMTQEDEKYIVFAGLSHGTDFGGELKSIHQRLNVPRITLHEGDYALAKHPFSKFPSFAVTIPPAAEQDERDKTRQTRSLPIGYNL